MDAILQKMRGISHHLRPPLLDEIGLCAAIRWHLDELNKRGGIDTSLDVTPSEFPRLRPEIETTIFRIVQEALTNVLRHSGAHRASVSLAAGHGQVVVIVRDDGRGIGNDSADAPYETVGAGLGIMKQRARDLGGELLLQNMSPGTVVQVRIPIIERQAVAAKSKALSPTRLAD